MSLYEDINLEHRPELYGFLSLWLMVFHLDMFFKPLLGSVFLDRIASLGDCCVDVFLFISGYCIYYSWTKNPDYRTFLKKRVLRILPTYLIIAIPFFLWQDHLSWNFLYDTSGASFLIEGRLEAWFPISILGFYLISPWLIRLVSGKNSIWIILTLIAIIAILTNYTHYFAKTGIMWTRLPAYAAGLYCAHKKGLMTTSNKPVKEREHPDYILLLLYGTLMIIIAISPIRERLSSLVGSNSLRLCFLILIVPILSLFNYGISFTPKLFRSGLRFCGNVSLEIYLIHLFLLYVISYYGLSVYLYPIALLASIPLAYLARLLVQNAPRLAHHRA